MIFRFEITVPPSEAINVKELIPKTWRIFRVWRKFSYDYVNGGIEDNVKGYRIGVDMTWDTITAAERADVKYIIDAIKDKNVTKLTMIKNRDGSDTGYLPSGGYPVTFRSDEENISEGDILEVTPFDVTWETRDLV